MAYAPEFEYDIFISYSHDDNYHAGDKPGWVDEFHAELKSGLVNLFGYDEIKIWRDEELGGQTVFDSRIEEVIKGSALFFALTSPNYFKSDYCRKELNYFIKQAKESKYGLVVGAENERRLFNILLRNIPYKEWPEELRGAGGFHMHDAEEKSDKRGHPIYPGDDSNIFRKKINKIIDSIETTLNAFPPIKIQEKEEPFRIFVADVSDTLQDIRDGLIADLKDKNIDILADIPPPMENKKHENSVAKAINDANLSVHLLDKHPGRKIMDLKTTTYPRRQMEIGRDSGTQQLIWVPKHLKPENIEDKDYRAFLQSLENDARKGETYEFSRDPETYLSNFILEKIDEIQQQPRVDEDVVSILLDTHQKDRRFASKLADYLSFKGLKFKFTRESRNPDSRFYKFEKYLNYARNLVIIFGRVAPAWVLERLKKTIKLINTQPSAALENRWIYLLPSSKITDDIDNLARENRISYLDNRHTPDLDERVVELLLTGSRG